MLSLVIVASDRVTPHLSVERIDELLVRRVTGYLTDSEDAKVWKGARRRSSGFDDVVE